MKLDDQLPPKGDVDKSPLVFSRNSPSMFGVGSSLSVIDGDHSSMYGSDGLPFVASGPPCLPMGFGDAASFSTPLEDADSYSTSSVSETSTPSVDASATASIEGLPPLDDCYFCNNAMGKGDSIGREETDEG